jgi:hypothetical protein
VFQNPDYLTALFNKFAGRIIHDPRLPLREDVRDPRLPVRDHVIEEMEKVAKDNNLHLRLLFPTTTVTKDFRSDRINARIDREQPGSFRIKDFYIG